MKLFSRETVREILVPKKEVTVQEIHDEFDEAVESVVDKAKEILKQANEEDRVTANGLEKLGFSNLGLVKQYKEINQKEKESVEMSKYSAYYKEKYGLKFITESLVKDICKKYGLVMGSPSDFIGEIPTKNRKEILDFKLNTDDAQWYFSIFNGFSYSRFNFDTKEQAEDMMNRHRGGTVESGDSLKIVGTIDQFNLKDKIISDYEIKSKDPIVLQSVKGGYLIISKWGNEESIL